MSRNYRRYKGKRPRNKYVAALLAFTFGGFGVHKFYLNEPGQGIMFVFLFFMTVNIFSMPVSAILGIIDAFRLLTMSNEDFHHKYNRGAHVNPTNRAVERETRNRRRRGAPAPVRKQRRAPSRAAVQRANPFKKSGIKKYKDFDLEGAIQDFKKGLEINNQDVALHFNIANAYSLTEQEEKAYYHLDQAVQLGFTDFELLNTKDDLAFVRIQPQWDDFKANGYKLTRGMFRGGQPQQELNTAELPTDDVLLSQLNKLAELRKKGLLSQDEFMMERKKLMNRR